MDTLWTQSGVALARAIRNRTVSSREVVELHIDRIARFNPQLNAVVRTRFEQARAEADAADERVRSDDPASLPPFHGVPCTIKECFAFVGMPNTSGLVSRKDVRVDRDATAVARLRSAGAIPMGVTNVSELCMWMESDNKVYGRTNNPYDVRRTVGGSSGGEGAIVGVGASPFGLGSDVGGSIRMPAFFNGVFGHKPTGGLVPATGQYPVAEGAALRYLTTGPLARCAEDLWPLLQVLRGPDGEDAGTLSWALGDPDTVNWKGATVLSIETNGMLGVHPSLTAAQRRAADFFASQGARVETAKLPRLRHSLAMWSSMMSAANQTSYASLLGDGTPIATGRELLRWAMGRSPHTLPSLGLALLEQLPMLKGAAGERMIAEAKALRDELVERLGPRGILLYPPYTRTAPRHGTALLPPIQWQYTAVLNVMEIPVTQVPLGLDPNGIPLGVQVGAVHGNDHLTIAAARDLERAFGGWVPPAMAVV